MFFLTLGIILSGFIYMIYFQWNLMCIYKINGKPISQRKQPILQKVSAVIMYILSTVCVYEDAMIVVFDSMKVPVNVDEKVS